MWSYWIGNHQKINKHARLQLGGLTSLKRFPTNRQLRYFEGKRGPDGIKVKSPGEHEPHSFYDPFDDQDNQLVQSIKDHYKNLVRELKEDNQERAAFEASWLAHSVVDGLTPAHHFPYEETLEELDADKSKRVKLKDRLKNKRTNRSVVTARGSNMLELLKNNWRLYGFKGLLVTHASYEGGVAFIAVPLKFKDLKVTRDDINRAKQLGVEEYFEANAREVALMNMYDHYYRYGWTLSLARQTRDDLLPLMVKVVCVIWYLAMSEAGLTSRHTDENK